MSPPHDQVVFDDAAAALLARPADRAAGAYPDHAVGDGAPAGPRSPPRTSASDPPTCGCSTCGGTPTRSGSSTRRCSATPTYADLFAGDLAGRGRAKIDYLAELGVTYLHLMPLLKPRPGRERRRLRGDGLPRRPRRPRHHRRPARPGDRAARPGHLADPRPGAQPRRRRAPWAERRPRAATTTTAASSTCSPTASIPDAYERTLPEVFPDFAPGNFSYDERVATPGSGRRSTPGSGTSTGTTRTSSTSSPT